MRRLWFAPQKKERAMRSVWAWLVCGLAAGCAGAPQTAGAPLLWVVEGKGVAPAVVCGTLHVTDERVSRVSPELASALEACDEVHLASDASEQAQAMSPAVAGSVQQALAPMFDGGTTLARSTLRERSERYAVSVGLSAEDLAVLLESDLWFASFLLPTMAERAWSGETETLSARVWERSGVGQPLLLVEDELRFMAVLDDTPRSTQEVALASVLERLEARQAEGVSPMEPPIGSYVGGASDFGAYGVAETDLEKRYLVEVHGRHMEALLERIEERLRTAPELRHVFVVPVMGVDGVLAGLEAAGYEVRRVEAGEDF